MDKPKANRISPSHGFWQSRMKERKAKKMLRTITIEIIKKREYVHGANTRRK